MAGKHVVPGAHIYDGVKYFGPVTRENLDKVKVFQFREDDILVCTYPKTGKANMYRANDTFQADAHNWKSILMICNRI